MEEPEKYQSFKDIMNTYRQRTAKEVYAQVSTLFKDHSDLLSDYSLFLPDPSPGLPPAALPEARPQVPVATPDRITSISAAKVIGPVPQEAARPRAERHGVER